VYQVAEVSFVTSRVRALTLALSAAALISACGGDQPAATQSKPAALAPVSDSGYQLFLKTAYSSDTNVFDTQSQAMHHLPAGVMSEDGKRLLTIGSGEAGKKTLSAVDPATGAKLGEQTFEGSFQFPMVYANGTIGGLPGGDGQLPPGREEQLPDLRHDVEVGAEADRAEWRPSVRRHR
jgi:hypothetical protein